MARNMSFFLTTDQIREQTKTVTRRCGWKFLLQGDLLNACVKCQGLKKGESVQVLSVLRVVNVRLEPLSRMLDPEYGDTEARLEGFPEKTGREFVEMFCRHMGVTESQPVTRIEFEYVKESAA